MPSSRRRPRLRAPAWLFLAALCCAHAAGAAPLTILEVTADPPTVQTLGVQVLIEGDEDRDATGEVRYRRAGESAWTRAPDLFRVRPETVAVVVPEQLAGSLFDLAPGTAYEIELVVDDPDGDSDTRTLTLATRPLPEDPDAPRVVAVDSAASLQAALSDAEPGDLISVADGSYAGPFVLSASGTQEAPIVLRGASALGTVLDGGDCSCNVLEVYGSYVHVERMTLKSAVRALRFLGATTGNVARRLVIRDVVHGIGSQAGQSDFYLCDNDIEGRLAWPWTFAQDASSHWDDRGIQVDGDGHVVCHNRLRGFGDPVLNLTEQTRGWDVYGNDVLDAYDGTELDRAEGNVRLFRNRFTNVMVPVSLQPIHGGPAYVLRNVVMNAPEEQLKLKSVGGDVEPSGALIHHNTFVSPARALNLQTPITQHNFAVTNNLFVGPSVLAGTRVVEWTAVVDEGRFDHNGYFPDGGFWLGTVNGSARVYADFAAMQAAGDVESNGVLLGATIFALGFVGPVDGEVAEASPLSFALATTSSALEQGELLRGINDRFTGTAPDLGAVEDGCPEPVYGPRPAGSEHEVTRVDCAPALVVPDAGVPIDAGAEDAGARADAGAPPDDEDDDGGGVDGDDAGVPNAAPSDAGTPDAGAAVAAGCGCSTEGGSRPAPFAAVLLALAAARRRRGSVAQ